MLTQKICTDLQLQGLAICSLTDLDLLKGHGRRKWGKASP